MDGQSFFSNLFDMSFSKFVTPSIIRVVFVLAIIGGAFAAIGVFTATANAFRGGAFFGLVGAVIAFFVYVIMARVGLEAVVALFRVAENTKVLADDVRSRTGGA